ncbi:hypothetical protein IRJ41_000183, partial [Triplophysa rosa]
TKLISAHGSWFISKHERPGRLHLVKQNKGRSDRRVTSFLTYEQFTEQSHLTRVMLALNPAARTGDKECVKITFLREEARLNYGVQTAGAIFSLHDCFQRRNILFDLKFASQQPIYGLKKYCDPRISCTSAHEASGGQISIITFVLRCGVSHAIGHGSHRLRAGDRSPSDSASLHGPLQEKRAERGEVRPGPGVYLCGGSSRADVVLVSALTMERGSVSAARGSGPVALILNYKSVAGAPFPLNQVVVSTSWPDPSDLKHIRPYPIFIVE